MVRNLGAKGGVEAAGTDEEASMKSLVTGAAVAALLLSAPAVAKEPTGAKLCGPDECATVTDRGLLLELVDEGGPDAPAPAPGPYYELELEVDGHAGAVPLWYVPGANVVRQGDAEYPPLSWKSLGPAAAARLEQAVDGVAPFRVPAPTGARIGGRPVDDPSSYLRLFSAKSSGDAVPSAGDWKVITFSGPPSPWTDNLTQLEYSPAADLLQRGSEFVKLSPSLAASVEAGRSIAPPGSGFPWLYVAIAALAVAACASALLVIRRSRLPRTPEARIDLS
jgi:hypothetical protein